MDAFPAMADVIEDEHPNIRVVFNFSGSAKKLKRSRWEGGCWMMAWFSATPWEPLCFLEQLPKHFVGSQGVSESPA